MVATTKSQQPDCLTEDPLSDPAAPGTYGAAGRTPRQSSWTRHFFATFCEAPRRYLELVAKVNEICLFVPAEQPG